jgi:hypothetical protein
VAPGANLGETFTASIPDRPVIPQSGETFFDSISFGIRGTLAGGTTVVLETFLGLVNPLLVVANEPRIVIQGRDAFALSTAWYGKSPAFNEGATATTDTVYGVRVPLNIKVQPKELYSYSITRSAVTNISAEVVSAGLYSLDHAPLGLDVAAGMTLAPKTQGGTAPTGPDMGRWDIRQITATLPGATGFTQLVPKLPKIGLLRGMLVFSTTVPTSAAVTTSIQRLQLSLPTYNPVDATWQELQAAFLGILDFTRADATALVIRQVLQNYGWIELRDTPLDLVGNDVAVNVDAEVASDAVRLIPVIEIPQPAAS